MSAVACAAIAAAAAPGLVAALSGVPGSFAVNVLSNVAHDGGKVSAKLFAKHFRERVKLGFSLPENHDVARAVRLAQLEAIGFLVQDFAEAASLEAQAQGGDRAPADIEAFAKAARKAIKERMPLIGAIKVDEAMSKALSDAVDAALLPFESDDARSVRANDDLRQLRDTATNATWAEFEAAVGKGEVAIPVAFAARFKGAAGRKDGWFAAYSALLAEHIKADDRFFKIEMMEGGAQTRAAIAQLDRQLKALAANWPSSGDDWKKAHQDTLLAVRDQVIDLRTEQAQLAGLIRDDIGDFRAQEAKHFDTLHGALTGVARSVEALRADIRAQGTGRRQVMAGLRSGRSDFDANHEQFKARPTALLIARYQVVPFLDRGNLLADAVAWATNPSGRRAKGRLYPAPGGFGKTRLGIELIAELEAKGWSCTFLSQANAHALTSESVQARIDVDESAGHLIVVDYAEGQLERLRLIADIFANANPHGPPLRLMALARSGMGWWEGLVTEDGPAEIFDPAPAPAIAYGLSLEDRLALYELALTAIREKLLLLGLDPADDVGTRRDLTDDTFDRPLMVISAAYLAASGGDRPGQSLFEMLYRQERLHWQRILGVKADDAPEMRGLARAAAQVTLVQGATPEGLEALIAADPIKPYLDGRQLSPLLIRLYGRAVVWTDADSVEHSDTLIGAIEPDLLGEHATMRILESDQRSLAAATLSVTLNGPPLFSQDPGEVLTVLTRSTRPEHEPRVRQSADGAIGGLIRLVEHLSVPATQGLERSLPPASTALRGLALAVCLRLLDQAPEATSEEGKSIRAGLLNNVGIRYSALGRRDEALAASAKAVEIYRELTAKNRDAFLPDLGVSLNNVGIRYSALGRRDEALAASAEAVEIYRELTAKNRDAFLPDLGASLNNVGIRYSELGRRDEALAASAESVEIRRELTAKNRDAFLPDLGASLNNVGIRYSELGRRDEALAASAESVEIRRELTAKNRDAFLPDLAMSLSNVGIRYSELGRRDEALAASAKAVEIYRELTAKNRDAFAEALAHACGARAQILRDWGDHEGAVAVLLEGIEAINPLMDRYGASLSGLYSQLVRDLLAALDAAGRSEEAAAIRKQLGLDDGSE